MENRKGFIKGALLGALSMLLVIVIVAGAGGYFLLLRDGQVINNETKMKLESLQHIIAQAYLYEDEVDAELLRESAIKGYVDGLGDPYTVYYNKDLLPDASGEYAVKIEPIIENDPFLCGATVSVMHKNETLFELTVHWQEGLNHETN